MKKIIIFFCFLSLLSCKKENYIETKKQGDLVQKITYSKGIITNSKSYNLGKLETEFTYINGKINKVYQYYPSKKVHSFSYLLKKPNHFFTKIYFENGKTVSEGEGDYFMNKNSFLRRGGWIFYNKSGQPYSILEFVNDGEREYLQQETIYDTIKKKIIKDKKYDNPILVK